MVSKVAQFILAPKGGEIKNKIEQTAILPLAATKTTNKQPTICCPSMTPKTSWLKQLMEELALSVVEICSLHGTTLSVL